MLSEFLWMALAAAPSPANEVDDAALLQRVVVEIESARLTYDIVHDRRFEHPFRRVVTSCKGSCDEFIRYLEDTPDNIVSVQFDTDEKSVMFVTWVTGSAYRVQAFSVTSGGFRKRFEAGSSAPPVVFFSRDARLRLVLESRFRAPAPCALFYDWREQEQDFGLVSGNVHWERPVCAEEPGHSTTPVYGVD